MNMWNHSALCCCLIIVSLYADSDLVKHRIVVIRKFKQEDKTLDQNIFAERLNRMDDALFRNTFIGLDTRTKLYYFTTLNQDTYEQFLERFKDETDWNQFRNQLSENDKKHIPETLESQRTLLRDAYYEIVKQERMVLLLSWWIKTPTKQPTDLRHWKSEYHRILADHNFHTEHDPSGYRIELELQLKRMILLKYAIP